VLGGVGRGNINKKPKTISAQTQEEDKDKIMPCIHVWVVL
jgi:hypothetical protein